MQNQYISYTALKFGRSSAAIALALLTTMPAQARRAPHLLGPNGAGFQMQTQYDGANAKFRLCYISLNNAKEFKQTHDFVERVQNMAGQPGLINVQEFQKQGADPQGTVMNLVNSGIRCDGLVISGHHTGAFGGHQADGKFLTVDFLEQKSCEPKNIDWFAKVNALWLQGCRTLGALAESNNPDKDLAEFHAQRVVAVEDADGLTQSRWQLEREFALVLDTETPYASRWLRIFGNAEVFGWIKTAPGEKAGSELSVIYHIGDAARRLSHEKNGTPFRLASPLDPNMDSLSAKMYLQALTTMLTSTRSSQEITDDVEGWKDHGKPAPRLGIYGLDNADINSHPPLNSGTDDVMRNARSLECSLRTGSAQIKLDSLKLILANEKTIALSFYTLKSVIHDPGNPLLEKQFRLIAGASSNLRGFLERKLTEANVGLVNRMDYLSFYKDLTNLPLPELTARIKQQAIAKILEPIQTDGPHQIPFKAALIEAVADNHMVSSQELVSFFSQVDDDSVVMASAYLLNMHPEYYSNPSDAAALLLKRNLSPNVRNYLLTGMLHGRSIPGYANFFTKAYQDTLAGAAESASWSMLATGISYSMDDVPNADTVLATILQKLVAAYPKRQETFIGLGAIARAATSTHLTLVHRAEILRTAQLALTNGEIKNYPLTVFPVLQALRQLPQITADYNPVIAQLMTDLDSSFSRTGNGEGVHDISEFALNQLPLRAHVLALINLGLVNTSANGWAQLGQAIIDFSEREARKSNPDWIAVTSITSSGKVFSLLGQVGTGRLINASRRARTLPPEMKVALRNLIQISPYLTTDEKLSYSAF